MENVEPIVAIATAQGHAGIGVLRLSGSRLDRFFQGLLGHQPSPTPREAAFRRFLDRDGSALDEGIMLYFPGPASFTGEDVLELQAHGGPAVLQLLLSRCQELGARLAQPGEFTRRAFLNGKLDLAQAEAVADLIAAESSAAARGALRSLNGAFSERVNLLVGDLVNLRLHVEGSIDFSDEDLDFLSDFPLEGRLKALLITLDTLSASTRQGLLLGSGCHVVLVGAPNVGKSSLLNALAEDDLALVTDVPGTTRDTIRTRLIIQGVPFHVVDTAGIRETADALEQAGIERTWQTIGKSDLALVVADARDGLTREDLALLERLPSNLPRHVVFNKADLLDEARDRAEQRLVSARTGQGLQELKEGLLEWVGWKPQAEPLFVARQRHLEALQDAGRHMGSALQHKDHIEFLAEDLRLAQEALSRITGEFSSDDLLGEIFSRFCIGK